MDLGCGAGWFSWVFLDWAAERGVGYDRLDLYGLDHCPAMLQLAQGARRRLLQYVPDYPVFHCSSEVDALCGLLTENHRENTDYTVTLVLQRRFLNLISFWPEIAWRKARPQSCQARGQTAPHVREKALSCPEPLLWLPGRGYDPGRSSPGPPRPLRPRRCRPWPASTTAALLGIHHFLKKRRR